MKALSYIGRMIKKQKLFAIKNVSTYIWPQIFVKDYQNCKTLKYLINKQPHPARLLDTWELPDKSYTSRLLF